MPGTGMYDLLMDGENIFMCENIHDMTTKQ